MTRKEVLDRINAMIDDLMDLAIALEFGGWDEFDKRARELYHNIPLPSLEKNEGVK